MAAFHETAFHETAFHGTVFYMTAFHGIALISDSPLNLNDSILKTKNLFKCQRLKGISI